MLYCLSITDAVGKGEKSFLGLYVLSCMPELYIIGDMLFVPWQWWGKLLYQELGHLSLTSWSNWHMYIRWWPVSLTMPYGIHVCSWSVPFAEKNGIPMCPTRDIPYYSTQNYRSESSIGRAPDCLHKSVNENCDMPKISPNCPQAQWVIICCTSQY